MSVATMGPNEAARELTGRDYISWSAISTFRQCPLRYYFKYVLGLPEETVAASLVFGGAIHAAVEHYFRELLAGTRPTAQQLFDIYIQAWEDRELDTVLLKKGETITGLHELARRMLQAFLLTSFATPDGTIIGIEEELRGQVVPGCPDLLARVDLIVQTADTLVVTDLKTARSRWSGQQASSSAEQLLLYSELARELAPDRSFRLQFAVITKSKMPVLDFHTVRAGQHAMKRTLSMVQQVWKAIDGGRFYPNPSPLNCPTCPYQRPCRAWCGSESTRESAERSTHV